MKEKGGHFVRSVALALAAHALLFLVFACLLIRHNPIVAAAGIDLVEIQLAGAGGQGGGGGTPAPGAPAARARPRSPAKPAPRPSVQPPAPPVPSPAPSPPPVATPSTVAQPQPDARRAATDDVIENGARVLPSSAAGAQGSEGTGGTGGAGSGGAGTGGFGQAGVSISGPQGELPATIADIDPVPLQSISAPYPASAKRLGQQGLVKVRADVDEQGIVIGEQISVSSGFASLDNAALDAVKNARFLPAKKNGKSVAASIIVRLRFQLSLD